MIPEFFGWLVCATLVGTGASHASHLRTFSEQMKGQDLLPRSVALPVSLVVCVLELVIGVFGIIVLSVPDEVPIANLISSSSTGLLGTYSAYSLLLLIRRPDAPCACSSQPTVVSVWTLARSMLLFIGSIVWMLMGGTNSSSDGPRIATLGMALTAAWTLWLLPDALREPRHLIAISQREAAS